ncbi:hypothetical protein AB9K35_13990 [Leisingera sp. XS_AS12]|uniref:hypothetical protein n=1 Tax=Leisingera sp. XS_AS12 TaxID=3241294 RepID=UPI003511C471
MKPFVSVAAAVVLTACAAPERPDYWTATRTGHGGNGSAPMTAPDLGYRAGAEAALAPHVAMRPGVHRTRSGAPWLVAHSAGFQAGGPRLNPAAAAQAALTYMERERSEPYAAQAELGNTRARFRIVTVDGSSFAVLFALNMPKADLRAPDSAALQALTAHAAQLSGCRVIGAPLVQQHKGPVRRLAAPVSCG